MKRATIRVMLVAPLGLTMLLMIGLGTRGAQAPESPPPGTQGKVTERDHLVRQVQELRRAGKFDEAVLAAERALELERRVAGGESAGVANALSRLAELHELEGDWGRAAGRCREALAMRERLDGKDHWRTVNGRLALTFAEKVSGLSAADRAKVQGALRTELGAARLEQQRKYAEAERATVMVLETYQSLVGLETAEVARLWNQMGHVRWRRNDAHGAMESTERALRIRRKVLPPGHPDIADSLNGLGKVQSALRDYAAAKTSYEESLAIFRKALSPGNLIIATNLTGLGIVHVKLGAYASAKANFKEALDINRKGLPPGHMAIAFSLRNLGMVQSELREYEASKASFTEALAIFRKALAMNHPYMATSLNDLGNVQRNLREYAAAKASHEEALAIRRKTLTQDHPDVASSLTALGVVQRALLDYAGARKRHEEALSILRKILPPDDPKMATCLNYLGDVQHKLKDYATAKASFEEALAIGRTALPNDRVDIAQILDNLGIVQRDLREYAASKASFEEALAIRRKTLSPGHVDIAGSLRGLGNVQYDLGEYAAASVSHQEALAILRKALPQDHPDIATSLHDLGTLQRALGDFAASKASREEALAICRKALPPDHPDIALRLIGLGSTQADLREYAAAKMSFAEALAIYRRALPPDHPDIATGLNNLGNIQEELREYAAAIKTHEEALTIRRKALPTDHLDIAKSLSNLGNDQEELREYAAAKSNLQEALSILRKAMPPDHPDIATSLNNLGIVQRDLREYTAAMASHEEALGIRRKALPPGHPNISDSLSNLGVVQCKVRDYAAARASFEEALAIRRKALPPGHPNIAGGLNNLAAVQLGFGEYAAAKASFEEALAIQRQSLPKDNPEIASALSNLALLALDLNADAGDAIPRLVEAIDILQVDQLRLAAAQAESEQLVTAARSRLALCLLIDATLITRGNLSLAYDRAVSVKGSVTARQRWARQARDAADPETARLLDRLREVTIQIVGLSTGKRRSDRLSDPTDVPKQLRALSNERSRLDRQLTERSAIYRMIQSKARIGANEVQNALMKGTVLIDLVEYLQVAPGDKKQGLPPLEPRLAAFVLRPERQEVAVVSLGPSQLLAKLIDRWRASYGADKTPADGAPDPGAELRKRLWEPLAKYMDGVKVVLISPDGPLNLLPWAALPGLREGTFLIEEYAFAVVPVPQLLPELLRSRAATPAEPASLVVGNIDFDALSRPDRAAKRENHFSPLPGTMAEAAAIYDIFRSAFAGRPASMLTGKEATKQTFVSRAPISSHLLVATHGFFLPEPTQSESSGPGPLRSLEDLVFSRELVTSNPALRSGLVFAGANYEATGRGSSFLTALEAAELDLGRVDLAVLSACETGLGMIEGGEGVLGLQRAFQLAGARTAVTSLWKVPDAATQALMTRFHRNLWERQMGKLEALREAQLWLIKEGRNHPELQLRGGLERPEVKQKDGDAVSPFYWAAFVLSGDWR